MPRLATHTDDRTRQNNQTGRLVDAIAQEMWSLYSRRGILDWVGIERHLDRMVVEARRDAGRLFGACGPARSRIASLLRPARSGALSPPARPRHSTIPLSGPMRAEPRDIGTVPGYGPRAVAQARPRPERSAEERTQ